MLKVGFFVHPEQFDYRFPKPGRRVKVVRAIAFEFSQP
jgi:hypothetical protein